MDVSIREFKSRLSHLLNRVTDGEQITVTKRGRPIAVVTAVPPNSTQDPLERLAQADWVTPPSHTTGALGMSDPPQTREGEQSLSDIVREDRG